MLRFLWFDLDGDDRSYVDENILEVSMLCVSLVTVVHCLVRTEKRGRHRKKR